MKPPIIFLIVLKVRDRISLISYILYTMQSELERGGVEQ